ncbi:MAG: phosphoglucosamine mutase [Oligoflexia bacterium]|nr:phosphoglucosamine mutase [Oligoflexia bacterium]
MQEKIKKERRFFGTDGIRGVASVPPLDPESLVRLGKSIARQFLGRGRKHRILIGKDTRLSGYMIETSLAAGITSMGADVLLCGPIPTPGVAYLTRSMRADAGIMISASHNAYEDNGIKIFGADGFKLPDELELQIEALMEPGALEGKGAAPSEIGKAQRINDAVGRYTVYLKGSFPREIGLDGVKIGVDCANGAGYVVTPLAFTELGAEVVSRGVSPNGRNINAGFGSLFPEVVSKLVAEYTLDVGVALDGDGDRAMFSDEKGALIDGDVVLAILGKDLKERGLLTNNVVVGTVMSNLGLDVYFSELGIKLARTAVGDRYVLEEMRKLNACLGGEQSGHVILSNYSTSGDGTLTALAVLSVMLRSGKPLSALAADFKRFPQKLISIPVSRKPPLDSLEQLQRLIHEKEKTLGERGRVLVRYSGTENKVRVMVECEDEDSCRQHADDLVEVVEREIGAL